MCRVSGEHTIESITDWEHMSAVGIGPGLGTSEEAAQAFFSFLDECKNPMVVDADALNLIARQPELLAKLPKGSVLTPHPKEFSRLFGDTANSMVQVDHARIQAMRYNINIVLKGHHTAVITPEGECWYNTTGNAGMATAGSGDVLTGILTGLVAQGYEPADASLLGVYLHGLAGDIAAVVNSQESLIAGDIIEYLGKAFKALN
jgi:NAD(P)H-hydrate epimerase